MLLSYSDRKVLITENVLQAIKIFHYFQWLTHTHPDLGNKFSRTQIDFGKRII